MTFDYDFKEARDVRLSYEGHLSNRLIVSSMYNYAAENNLLVILRKFMYLLLLLLLLLLYFQFYFPVFLFFLFIFCEIVVIVVDVVLHLFIFIWNISLNIYVTETVRFNGLYMVLVKLSKT